MKGDKLFTIRYNNKHEIVSIEVHKNMNEYDAWTLIETLGDELDWSNYKGDRPESSMFLLNS